VLSTADWYTVKPTQEDPRKKIPLVRPQRAVAPVSRRPGKPFPVFGLVVALLLLGLGATVLSSGLKEPNDLQSLQVLAGLEQHPPARSGHVAAPIAPSPPEDKDDLRQVRSTRTGEPVARGSSRTLRMLATAYTLECGNGDGYTATMTRPRIGIVAVDPRVIPYGYLVYIEGYGYFRAEDTGGDIKGDRIDIYMPSREEALSFGRRWVEVKVIGRIEE